MNNRLARFLAVLLTLSMGVDPSLAVLSQYGLSSPLVDHQSLQPYFATEALNLAELLFGHSLDKPDAVSVRKSGASLLAMSMFGEETVQWLADLRQEVPLQDRPYEKIFQQQLGFGLHKTADTLASEHSYARHLLAAIQDFESRQAGVRERLGKVKEVRVLTGDMSPSALQALLAKGYLGPHMRVDTIGHTLVVRETLQDGTYRVWLHEKSLASVAEYLNHQSPLSTPERRDLVIYALFFHENVEGNIDDQVSPQPGTAVTHGDLVTYGATFEGVAEALRTGTGTHFTARAVRELGISWQSVGGRTSRENEDRMGAMDARIFVTYWVPLVMNMLRQGRYQGIRFLYNFKEMSAGEIGRRVHRADDQMFDQKYGNNRIQMVETAERPDQRDGDLPALVGAIGDYKATYKTAHPHSPDWPEGDEEAIAMVPEGGFKTRSANETLSWAYTGLPPVPGPRYHNMREVSFINTLALMEILPDGIKRFLGLGGGDNMIFAGEADIGGLPVSHGIEDQRALRTKLARVSVLFGGARVEILTSQDLHALHAIKLWGGDKIGQVLGMKRWEEIREEMKRQKLFDLGMFRANKAGHLTGFAEKIKGDVNMVKFLYDSALQGEDAYKNPFHQYLDKRFASKLHEKLAEKGLADLKASYYQVIYQSHFMSMEEWKKVPLASYKGPKLTPEEQGKIKEAVDELWKEEADEGRGEILVLNYGPGHRWLDIGNIAERDHLGDAVANDPVIRRDFGIPEYGVKDDETVRFDVLPELDSKGLYLERVIVTGGRGAKFIVRGGKNGKGTYLRNVRFLNVPDGATIEIPAGAKITESVFDFKVLGDHGFLIQPEAMVEGIFAIEETGVTKVVARSEERLTMLFIDGHWALHSSPKEMDFKGKSIGTYFPTEREYEVYRGHHPGLLPYGYDQMANVWDKEKNQMVQKPVQAIEFIQMPYPELGQRAFDQTQRVVDYGKFAEKVDENNQAINVALGLPPLQTQQLPGISYSRRSEALRWARRGALILLASLILILAGPLAGLTSFVGAASLGTGSLGLAWSLAQVEKYASPGDATYNSITGQVENSPDISQFGHEIQHPSMTNHDNVKQREEWWIEAILTPMNYWVRHIQHLAGSVQGVIDHLREKEHQNQELQPQIRALRDAAHGSFNIKNLGLKRLGEVPEASSWFKTALLNLKQMSRLYRVDAYQRVRKDLYDNRFATSA